MAVRFGGRRDASGGQDPNSGRQLTCPHCWRTIAAQKYDQHVERCEELARRRAESDG